MDQKEIYVVTFADGTGKNVLASTYQEILAMYGEENIVKIEKSNYEGEQK